MLETQCHAVTHMMTGKAVSRAVRGHLLVDAALNTILLADVYNVPAPRKDAVQDRICGDETNETETIDTVTTDLTDARELYMRTMSSSLSVDVC